MADSKELKLGQNEEPKIPAPVPEKQHQVPVAQEEVGQVRGSIRETLAHPGSAGGEREGHALRPEESTLSPEQANEIFEHATQYRRSLETKVGSIARNLPFDFNQRYLLPLLTALNKLFPPGAKKVFWYPFATCEQKVLSKFKKLFLQDRKNLEKQAKKSKEPRDKANLPRLLELQYEFSNWFLHYAKVRFLLAQREAIVVPDTSIEAADSTTFPQIRESTNWKRYATTMILLQEFIQTPLTTGDKVEPSNFALAQGTPPKE